MLAARDVIEELYYEDARSCTVGPEGVGHRKSEVWLQLEVIAIASIHHKKFARRWIKSDLQRPLH